MNKSAGEKFVVGLMSGTSLDGIDAALVSIKEENEKFDIKLISFSTLPFSGVMKEKILELCNPERARIEDISSMNMLLGEQFADAAKKVVDEAKMSMDQIDMISSHGQTIFHQPEEVEIAGHSITSTLQIGDIAVIAERTGVMTIGDFRTRDMAAGGQGAPLVPYADYLLLGNPAFGRVLVNIGGIANITVLPAGCDEHGVLAFDTGPGNMLIDAFTELATEGKQSFDKNGEIAARGKVNEGWLKELLAHPYYQLEPPKSTGRELFGHDYAKRLWEESSHLTVEDRIATITELTARTLANGITHYIEKGKIEEVLISGGGWHNKTLLKSLRTSLPPHIRMDSTEQVGLSGDAKEAIVFALLGYQCFMKRTNNLPAATGAKKPVIMGKIAW
ncbi:anhydro-N-acetylmuramic acid kinase [Neobacillus niacini]|uniref:anhydro-N-acetylmuramic acid kinase n=1 Tax=Neobacillus niacini TaxID=86668 RepID=UPI002FFD671D